MSNQNRNRIEAALEATGLLDKYIQVFNDTGVNDVQVSLCIKNPTYKMLHEVIESPDDYDLFVDAYTSREKFQSIRHTVDEDDERDDADIDDYDENNENDSDYDNKLNENSNLAELNNMNSVNSASKSKWKSIPLEMTNNTRPVLRDIVYKEKSKMKAQGPFATYSFPSSSSKPPNPTMKSIKGFTKFLTTLKRYRNPTTEENGSLLQLNLNQHHEDSNQMLRMKPFRHTMEPVQIIDIPLKSSNSSNSLIFNQEPLQEILSRVGRRPVALLSIAGPSRQGKSFILSYMVKYLKATSISTSQNPHSQSEVSTLSTTPTLANTDWMGKSGFKKSQPLLEGFLWRSGVERETTGIWMWPEPFTLKAPDGSEFDVLLVDTQGVFDDYTDRKDWATIVGLSLLTSSCLIFNIMNNLQEDSLITLKDFMDFGLMAKTPTDGGGGGTTSESDGTEHGGDRGGDRDEKPFQKLLFLIRDWNTPDDYPFGAEGGAAFLEANLNRKNTESGQQLRTQMKDCFEQLDCFLMPDPGSAVKRKTFDGSVANMAPEFADNMEKFIEHIFHPSQFPPKIISGHPVTGDDLLLFFEQYVKIFNSDQMPSPQDLNEANVTICHQTILNKAFTIYEQGMQQLPDTDADADANDEVKGQRSFVLDSELHAIHESASEQALQIFGISRKMGSEVQIGKTKDILLQRIKDFYRLVSLENTKLQNDCVEEATPKLEEYFISLMEEKIAQASACNGLDDFIQQDIFTAIFTECQASSLTFFQGYLKIETLDLLPSAQTKFVNVLKSLKEPMELQNKMKMSEAESQMKEEISKLSADYKAKMYIAIDKFKYWTPEQLHSEEGNMRENAFSKFETIYSQSALYPQGANLLNEAIQKLFQGDISNFVGLQNQNFLMSCSHLVSEMGSSYARKMDDSARDGELGTAGHDEEKQRCLNELKNSEDFHRLPPFEEGEFLSNLSTRINVTWQNLVDKWFPRLRQKSIKNIKDKLTAFYDATGTQNRNNSVEVDGLNPEAEQDHLRSFKSSALEEFKEFTENIPVPAFGVSNEDLQVEPLTPSKVLADFETEVDNLMEIIHANNKLRLEATHKNLSGFLSKAKSMFLEIVAKINQECFPKDKFQPIFQEAKERVMLYFQGQCNAYKNSASTDDQPLDLKPAIFELDEFIENIAKFHTEDGCPSALEISGPSLKFSRELSTLENCQSSALSRIKEVRWIASQEIHMDANLCGEFWSGQNLVICAPQVIVAGNERLVVVSGENGKSAQVIPPSTPTNEPGVPGLNGADGEPGESGGNVLILSDEICNAGSLRIISNGAIGGNGQPGGNGSNGTDGINGDQRFLMSLPDLELKFPSPAKLMDSKSNLKKGLEYLMGIAISHKTQVQELKCINSSSKCWTVETREGATFRYGFFQGGLKGLVRGRSFYVWFQGAPGTLGQLGGEGGLGGRGGSPGNPGSIKIPEKNYGIKISKRPGAPGINGRDGLPGKNGLDGQQGTDYAIVDPYAGLYVPSNFISKKRFSGRLGIYFVKYRQRAEAAFCPHEKKYMTFIEVYSVKEGVKGHEDETTAPLQRPERMERKPMVLSRSKKQIKAEKIQIRRYSINAYKPTPTVGRCGGFYVEESELRCCIENGFLGTSVIDTYAALLRELHLGSSNETTAYIPSTAFSFTSGQWVQAQYLEDMVKNIRNSTTIELTTVATIVSAGNHWMLLVANAMTGLIQIADTLNGHCNEAKLHDGVSIFVDILNVFFGVKNWSMKYFPKVAKQTDSHSCGPASLYFLEQLYKNSEIECYDPEKYQYYRRTIVKRILLSTDEGKKILQGKNDYTKYIENSTSTLI